MRRCHHGDGKAIDEDDYYEDVIKKLYKPAVKTHPTMGDAITQPELPFEIDPAPEPEPAVIAEPEPVVTAEPEPGTRREKEPTALDKLKTWLNGFMNDVQNE